jgi:hypothetical protein
VDVVEAALECRKEIRISKSETSSNNGKSDKPRSEDGEVVVVGAEGEDLFPGVAGVGGEMGVVSGLDGAVVLYISLETVEERRFDPNGLGENDRHKPTDNQFRV